MNKWKLMKKDKWDKRKWIYLFIYVVEMLLRFYEHHVSI